MDLFIEQLSALTLLSRRISVFHFCLPPQFMLWCFFFSSFLFRRYIFSSFSSFTVRSSPPFPFSAPPFYPSFSFQYISLPLSPWSGPASTPSTILCKHNFEIALTPIMMSANSWCRNDGCLILGWISSHGMRTRAGRDVVSLKPGWKSLSNAFCLLLIQVSCFYKLFLSFLLQEEILKVSEDPPLVRRLQKYSFAGKVRSRVVKLHPHVSRVHPTTILTTHTWVWKELMSVDRCFCLIQELQFVKLFKGLLCCTSSEC